jgi:phosphoglycolate phosphatase-like HAD superfamily hydrolase
MIEWMRALATKYKTVRRAYPDEPLMIVFDIDGTLLDMRHMVWHSLLAFDREHGTSHFYGLNVDDLEGDVDDLDELLLSLAVPAEAREHIEQWFEEYRTSPEAILASHQPFRGALEVVRWFQMQPDVSIGVNTGRPEHSRRETLRSLNALGSRYRVEFEDDHLFMFDDEVHDTVADSKAAALEYFGSQGYRVFAVVDDEAENIAAMADLDYRGRILFLHADTMFRDETRRIPRTVRGETYALPNLIDAEELSERATFVWHGLNNWKSLGHFLSSDIRWGECDVRFDPHYRIVLRREPFDTRPWAVEDRHMSLDDCISAFLGEDRGLKLDLKEGGVLVDRVLRMLESYGLTGERLWFNGDIDSLGESGFTQIAETFPDATLQCPVDFMTPLFRAVPDEARRLCELFASWGIQRFSLEWSGAGVVPILEMLESWGYETNIYGIPDLESFLRAALLLPTSLTSDFNFPAWYRGAAEDAPENGRPSNLSESSDSEGYPSVS